MATDSKQMSREELQALADKTLARRAQQKERQRKIRQEKRAAGLQSSTHWHPKPPSGYRAAVVFMPAEVAKQIETESSNGKTPFLTLKQIKETINKGNGMSETVDRKVFVLDW